MKTLPFSLSEIRALASKVFENPAAVSCEVEAAWGMVVVTRDLEIKMA